MFTAYDFTFAGRAASEFGLYCCDFDDSEHADHSFANKASIVEDRLASRITPLHYGVKYHDNPLEFTLIFAADKKLDRYQMQEVSNWLTGYQDYQWMMLEQPDMEYMQFRALCKELTPISVGWYQYAFEAEFICDCPYAYSFPWEVTYTKSSTSALSFSFRSDSTIHDNCKPVIKLVGNSSSGGTDITIANTTTGKTLTISDRSLTGDTVTIDCENEIISSAKGTNMYAGFNFQFVDLAAGDNTLKVSGSYRGSITLSGRFMYNVGA